MESSASASTLLEKLPPRPPTPPRETAALKAVTSTISLKPCNGRPSPLNPRISLHTPPNVNSPLFNAVTNSNDTPGRSVKRVEWSAHTEYKDPPDYTHTEKLYKSSSLSAASAKPVKGILKASPLPALLGSSLTSRFDGQSEQVNITKMLDETIKQLAGSDQAPKRDAYIMLSQALKTSNNLPDRVALQGKMSLLTQFIQRDVTAKENGSLDTLLVKGALTLLVTFLHFQAIASTISSDFAVFIIDHCIRFFENSGLTAKEKEIARQFMQVVAFQNFPPKVMTLDRVGRLVASLHNIEQNLMGKSIVMSRIHIYKKLVMQSRLHMAVHADWLKDMFTDMLSSIEDIQAQAIALGMEAGYLLRPGHQAQRKVTEILQTTSEDQTYIEYYIQRLQAMVKHKQRSYLVPQIWSVIILFLRCPLDKWESYGHWFSIIQAAFNTSDLRTKQEANYAWNRYAYLSLLDNKITQKMLLALTQPLLSQLRRRTNPKQLDEATKLRKTVIGGICNLYYYGFKPGHAKTTTSELVWDRAVYPVISQLMCLDGTREVCSEDILQASQLLVGLLDVSTPVVWREDRIMELPPVKPDELPSIESKWIRKNSEKVFKVVGPVLDCKFMDLANKDSLAYRLWYALVGSIALASAKDIKMSEDTAKFFACTLGLLSHIWSKGCPDNGELLATKFYPSVRNFIQVLIDALGILPFTEKKLSMTVSHAFEPTTTPSHRPDRPDKNRGVVRSSLHHLFIMLSSIPAGGLDDENYADFFQATFKLFLARKSEKDRISLTRELLGLLPDNTFSPFATWMLGARGIRLSLSLSSTPSPPSSDKLWGPDFREVTSFLERGFAVHPNLPVKHWLALLDTLSQRATDELGDAGRALSVTEPLAKAFVDEFRSNSPQPIPKKLEAVLAVLSTAKLPRDKQALEVARRRLWGAAPIPKGGSLDPFDHFYRLANLNLIYCFNNLANFEAKTQVIPLITTVGTFLKDSFSSTKFRTMSKLEDGLSLWLQDEKGQLSMIMESPGDAVRQLWGQICDELVRHGSFDKADFGQVDVLFTAAFRSKHRSIVNKAAETWNALVQDEQDLKCSDSLKSVVSSMRSRVNLVLPGKEQSSGEFGAQITFLDSQVDPSLVVLSSAASNGARPYLPSTLSGQSAEPALNSSLNRKRRLESTPEHGRAKATTKRATRSHRTSTPRLRHDDSQIQFESIDSSPPPEESQHLTERQREIREKQKQNATIYSDIGISSPAQAVDPSPSKYDAPVGGNKDQPKVATPVKASSYGELISSTPTPRRGQLIMEGENDPPSSPPEPRPCSLLSEIRSRSRASSSLDDWEFSSPPGSPVTSRQQVIQEVDTPQINMTDESTQMKKKNRRGRSAKKHSQSKELISSSVPVASEEAAELDSSAQDCQGPTTPHRQRTPSVKKTQETLKSDEEFVDTRSSPDHPSPSPHEAPDEDSFSMDASFALSEGDESRMMRLMVELESKSGNLPLHEYHSVSPENPITAKGTAQCTTVEVEESSDLSELEELMTESIIPSTRMEEDVATAAPDKRKKRKRGAKSSENRRNKRRRSLERVNSSQPDESQSQVSEQASSSELQRVLTVSKSLTKTLTTPLGSPSKARTVPLGARTRRSARVEERQQKVDEKSGRKDEGDTDEELMSQLIGESFAASKSLEGQQADDVGSPSVIRDSMDIESAEDKGPEEKVEDEVSTTKEENTTANPVDLIMESLKGGLDTLRNASLSRADVHRIEDMFMDMKRALYEAEQRGRESS